MAIPTWLLGAQGDWVGRSRLFMSWLPEGERVRDSDSTLAVRPHLGGHFATLDTTWHEDGPQEGTLLVCGNEEGRATGGWCDSWHQNASVLTLDGTWDDEAVRLEGRYAVPGHPDWGWRIALRLEGDELVVAMENVSPEGEAEPAVEARYRRAN